MSPINKASRTRLSEQFADIFQETQQDYRDLLDDLRNDEIDVEAFRRSADAYVDRLVKLKRIRCQLSQEREELVRLSSNGKS